MPRLYKIKWNENDEKELKRVVKNYNAKVNRLKKNADRETKAALPDNISVKQLKELINTRADLNRELNSLKRFSKRGSEEIVEVPGNDYNLKTTRWQKNEMSRRAATINRTRSRRRKEIAEIEMMDRGKKVGYKRGDIGMGSAEEKSLEPIKPFTSKMNRADFNMKNKILLKESQSTYWNERDEMMRQNYIKSLKENFNENDIKKVIDTIDKMDFKEFRKVFEAEGGNFELSYPPDKSQYQEYLTGIESIWIPNK